MIRYLALTHQTVNGVTQVDLRSFTTRILALNAIGRMDNLTQYTVWEEDTVLVDTFPNPTENGKLTVESDPVK